MRIGFIGLGKMGSQMVGRLVAAGHEVVVVDRNQTAVDAAVQQGATPAADRAALAQALGSPAIVWLMIPSAAVEAEVQALTGLLPKDSIIIDGGNSDYRNTRERAAAAASAGLHMVDVGTSGGVLGGHDGFCLMAGGHAPSITTITPLLQALAQPDGYRHVGPSGAGHFVKMVHNAIEYGLMESYAEGYRLLHEGDYDQLDLAAIAALWQHGSIIASTLNDVTRQALQANPGLDGIAGTVAESGEARWALEAARAKGVDMPAVQTALDVRVASQSGATSFATKLLAAMRNVFGGHSLNS